MSYKQEYKARVALRKLKENDIEGFKVEIDKGMSFHDFFNQYEYNFDKNVLYENYSRCNFSAQTSEFLKKLYINYICTDARELEKAIKYGFENQVIKNLQNIDKEFLMSNQYLKIAIINNAVNLIDFLIVIKGIDINYSKYGSYDNGLSQALDRGLTDSITKLMELGLDSTSDDYYTALVYASDEDLEYYESLDTCFSNFMDYDPNAIEPSIDPLQIIAQSQNTLNI